MIFTRCFVYPQEKESLLPGYKFHEMLVFYTLEGTEGIIDIFNDNGRSTPDLKVWQFANALKKKEMRVRR